MILQPSWSNSPELHFFKSILRCKVALGIKRTRHQLAPALPVQKIMDRAVAGCVPDRPLIGRLEIMDVSTSRTFLEKPRGKKRDAWFWRPEEPQALFARRILPFDDKAGRVWARLMAEGKAAVRPRSGLDINHHHHHHHRRRWFE
jgi:hypothetical protein